MSRDRPAAFIFIFFTVLLDMLALGLILPVLPKLIESFLNGDQARAAYIVGVFGTAWAVMQFLCSPLLGALSDKYGRRPVILFSNLSLGLDYILMALAPGLSLLFTGRLISGVASASISTANAYIADVTPPENRAQRYGFLGAAFGLGFTLGPALGGYLGGIGLRLPFWVAAGLSLANFCYGLLVLPESLKPQDRKGFSWQRANPFGALMLLLRQRALWGLALVAFLSQLAHTSLPAIFVLYAGYRYGWGPQQVGLFLMGVGIASLIVQGGLIRPLVKLLGERRALLTGLTCAAIGVGWYGTAWEGWLIWLGLPITAFWGLFQASAQSILTRQVSAQEQGRLQGALSSATALAGIFGPYTFAGILALSIRSENSLHLPGLSYWVASLILILALVLASRIVPKTK